MNRTTWTLAAVAAALAAFIFFVERGSLSTGETSLREGRVLPRFVRGKVSRIEVAQGDRRLLLTRGPDPEAPDQLGIWKLKQPVDGPADDAAVDALLGELEWMNARRRLEGLSAADRTAFGLDEPQMTLHYTVAGESHGLRVGNLSPMDDGHYVQADDPTVAFVVGKDLFEALDRDPRHYHDREVHEGGLYLSTVKWLEVTLRDRDGAAGVTRRFEKEGKRFWQVKPSRGWANRAALEALLDAFEQLEAKRYEAPADSDPAKYGLDVPKLSLVVRKRTMIEADGEEDRFEDRTFTFKLGAPCEGREGERALQATGGPVFCVLEPELQAGIDALAEPREARLLPLRAEAVDRIEVREGGKTLRVERREAASDEGDKQADAADTTDASKDGGDGGFHYRLSAGDQTLKEGAAEAESVRAWIAFLAAAKAEAFDQGTASGPVRAGQVSVEVTGADKTALTLTLYRDAAQGIGRVLVRRGDEPQLLAYPSSILTPLRASAAPFRKRALIEQDPAALREVTIARPPAGAAPAPAKGAAKNAGTEETLARDEGGGFRISGPVAMEADSVLMQDLARLLSGLQANQFISDAPAAEHGLARDMDAITVHFGFAGGDGGQAAASHRLVIGAEAPGLQGHYAQLDDDAAVFVVAQQLVDLVAQPLVSRVALAVPLEDLKQLDIAGPGGTCSVRASASPGSFAFEGKPASPQARAIAEALATLRAEGVTAYGAAAPASPAASTTLDITPTTGQAHRIILSTTEDGDRGLAHRAATPVGFWLSADTLNALTTCPAG